MSRGKLLLVLVVLAAVGVSKPQEYGGHSYKKPNLPFFSHRKSLSPSITHSNPSHNDSEKIESVQPIGVIIIPQEPCVVNNSPQPCSPTTKPVTPTKAAPPLRPTLPPRVTSTPSRPLPTKLPERTPSSWLTCITRRPPSSKLPQPCEQTRSTIPPQPPTTRAPRQPPTTRAPRQPPTTRAPRQPPCLKVTTPRPQPIRVSEPREQIRPTNPIQTPPTLPLRQLCTTRRPSPIRVPEPREQTRPTIQRQPPTTRAPPPPRKQPPCFTSTTYRPPPTRGPQPCEIQTRPTTIQRQPPTTRAPHPPRTQPPFLRSTTRRPPPTRAPEACEHRTTPTTPPPYTTKAPEPCNKQTRPSMPPRPVAPAFKPNSPQVPNVKPTQVISAPPSPPVHGVSNIEHIADNCVNGEVFPTTGGNCNQYMMCYFGKTLVMNCPAGLAFNIDIKSCDWADNVPTCNPPAFEGLTCPTDVNNDHIVKYRYRESCRQYVACHVGKPRLLSCEAGLFFDEYTNSCVDAEYVTNCSDFLY